eukprot:10557170-Prorocentrum_lima.AAC.1
MSLRVKMRTMQYCHWGLPCTSSSIIRVFHWPTMLQSLLGVFLAVTVQQSQPSPLIDLRAL